MDLVSALQVDWVQEVLYKESGSQEHDCYEDPRATVNSNILECITCGTLLDRFGVNHD